MKGLVQGSVSLAVGSLSALVLSFIVSVFSDTTPIASAHTISTAYLIAEHSTKCITHSGGTGNGGSIIQQTCNNLTNQRVSIEPAGSGYHYVRFAHSGRCLTLNGWNPNNGALLDQWDCLGQDNQKWIGSFTANGAFQTITQAWSGRCVTVHQMSLADGAAVNQWDCVGQSNQRFQTAAPPVVRWDVLPGIYQSSGITEYGWHFDELGFASFGARDFNHASDSGMTAYLRAKAVITIPYAVRYQLTQTTCAMYAQAQGYVLGQWTNISGSGLHYVHINPAPSNVTGSFQSFGTSTGNFTVGSIAGSGQCVFGAPHLHQSADLSTTSLYARVLNGSSDSCWTDVLANCNAFSWNRDRTSCTSYQSGSYSRNGTIAEYICQEWSLQSHGRDYPVFKALW